MISVPIFAGALMRFPLGVLSQYIGRKNTAIIEMSSILLACLYGFFFIHRYSDVLAMGILLGIAGASFGVALSLGSGWYPEKYKGLAMGIAGAGNSGTVIAALLAPPLATIYGWRSVYGFAAIMIALPIAVMIVFAKEPPDRGHQSLKEYLKCLWQVDGWVFNLIYIITFGGFIGLSTFLPTFFYSQFHVTKIEAGQLTVLATILGSGMRIVGGYISDRFGGIITLGVVLTATIAALFSLSFAPSLVITTILFMFCFAALGAGNGALFQLVPLRWPLSTAVAGSMIGEIGALGGSLIPNLMGQSKQLTGSFAAGFAVFAVITAFVLTILMLVQRGWKRTWINQVNMKELAPIPQTIH